MSNVSLLSYKGISPRIHSSVFLADGVRITGDVEIGRDSSVWFNTVMRGDVFHIRIGERTNIQDLVMLHVTTDTYPLIIGNDVTIGHSAIVHGCTVHDGALIGMGAILLDNCVIGEGSIIAAGTVVKEHFIVPPRTLVAGVPGHIIRHLAPHDDIEYQSVGVRLAKHYVNVASEYKMPISKE
jgi:carbonic anhydrase/acetyltransferase-like protein (isoleucine patch superfamily)